MSHRWLMDSEEIPEVVEEHPRRLPHTPTGGGDYVLFNLKDNPLVWICIWQDKDYIVSTSGPRNYNEIMSVSKDQIDKDSGETLDVWTIRSKQNIAVDDHIAIENIGVTQGYISIDDGGHWDNIKKLTGNSSQSWGTEAKLLVPYYEYSGGVTYDKTNNTIAFDMFDETSAYSFYADDWDAKLVKLASPRTDRAVLSGKLLAEQWTMENYPDAEYFNYGFTYLLNTDTLKHELVLVCIAIEGNTSEPSDSTFLGFTYLTGGVSVLGGSMTNAGNPTASHAMAWTLGDDDVWYPTAFNWENTSTTTQVRWNTHYGAYSTLQGSWLKIGGWSLVPTPDEE